MKLLMTGNPEYGLAEAFSRNISEPMTCTFASRTNGYDLTTAGDRKRFVQASKDVDAVINNSALHNFNQVILLRDIFDGWKSDGKSGLIINIGSSADRAVKSGSWLYPIEKLALRELSCNIASDCIWNKTGIRSVYLSFGTLDTPKVVAKHPDRKKMTTAYAAEKISWMLNQPADVNFSILNVDPIN